MEGNTTRNELYHCQKTILYMRQTKRQKDTLVITVLRADLAEKVV